MKMTWIRCIAKAATLVFAGYAAVASARYVQSDPIGLEGGINTYAYAMNSPTKYTDLLGLLTEICYHPGFAGGQSGWPHSYVCVNGSCRGFYPSNSVFGYSKDPSSTRGFGRMAYSDGGFRDDDAKYKPESYCVTPPKCDDKKMDQCVMQCKPPSYYNAITSNCATWANQCVSDCMIKSCIP
jgi:uncharacterized protein RhaS with RHS repeats